MALATPLMEAIDVSWKYPENDFVCFSSPAIETTRITDVAIEHLSKQCQNLKKLVLYGRGAITVNSLASLFKVR